MSVQYLVGADVDAIQRFIFGTSRLQTIRGSSAMVEAFGDKVKESLHTSSCRVIRHQGGQAVLLVEGEDPQDIIRELHSICQEVSKGGFSITTAQVDYPGEQTFQESIKQLFGDIQREKQANTRSGAPWQLAFAGGYMRHCDLCRCRPAVPNPGNPAEVFWQPGGDTDERRYLCQVCWERRSYAQQIPLEGRLITAMRAYRQELSRDRAWPADVRVAQVIDELWANQSEGRYLAMVSADGDSIGRLLSDVSDSETYRVFSENMQSVVIESIATAACKAGLDQQLAGKTIPLLLIVSGGDDFSVLLPVENAAEFSRYLGQAFAEKTKNPAFAALLQAIGAEQEFLTLSMGLAIAKPSFPFPLFKDLASQLGKSAKQLRAAGDVPDEQATIDFAVVTSSAVATLEDLHQTYERWEVGEQGLSRYLLSKRPYKLSQFHHLLSLADHLENNVPRGIRKQLFDALWQSRFATISSYLALQKRGKEIWDPLTALLGYLDCPEPDKHPFDDQNCTPLVDALELAEL